MCSPNIAPFLPLLTGSTMSTCAHPRNLEKHNFAHQCRRGARTILRFFALPLLSPISHSAISISPSPPPLLPKTLPSVCRPSFLRDGAVFRATVFLPRSFAFRPFLSPARPPSLVPIICRCILGIVPRLSFGLRRFKRRSGDHLSETPPPPPLLPVAAGKPAGTDADDGSQN